MEEVFQFYRAARRRNGSIFKVYEVSNYGRVKCNGVIIEPKSFSSGYLQCGSFYVHRAVAELFVPNPDNKPCVDHIDANRHNNIYTNLRWTTQSENLLNPISRVTVSETRKQSAKGNQNAKGSHSNRGQHWRIVNGKRVYYKEEQ